MYLKKILFFKRSKNNRNKSNNISIKIYNKDKKKKIFKRFLQSQNNKGHSHSKYADFLQTTILISKEKITYCKLINKLYL
jgi:hypothetical protein